MVDVAEVTRLLDERRRATTDRPIVAQSARNRFAGIVTRIEKDRVAAVVEVIAGPHRLVSLMTAEAVDDLGLEVGHEAVCVVKATNVIVEIPLDEGRPRVSPRCLPGAAITAIVAACSGSAPTTAGSAPSRRRPAAPVPPPTCRSTPPPR